MAINAPMPSTQESVMATRKVVAMITSSSGTTNTIDPCRGIIVSADIAVAAYFADAPSTAITLTLKGGLIYPFSVTAVTFASGTCHAIY
jgi:hypothetical protein